MKEMKLFYTPLWQASLADDGQQWTLIRQVMLDKVYALFNEQQGVAKTNFGGWQSGDDLYKYREFSWLIGRIMALGNEVAPAFSSTRKFDDGLLWANVNRKGHFNAIHTHPDAVLSGVVYLKCEKEEQGVIQFFDAREGSPTSHWRCFLRLEESTPLTSEVFSIVPKEGDILFFPGWLKHWVTPNLTDDDRVSISFNIRMQ